MPLLMIIFQFQRTLPNFCSFLWVRNTLVIQPYMKIFHVTTNYDFQPQMLPMAINVPFHTCQVDCFHRKLSAFFNKRVSSFKVKKSTIPMQVNQTLWVTFWMSRKDTFFCIVFCSSYQQHVSPKATTVLHDELFTGSYSGIGWVFFWQMISIECALILAHVFIFSFLGQWMFKSFQVSSITEMFK